VELTRRRVSAIEDSDAATLGTLVTPGGQAEAALAVVISELNSGAVDFDGLRIQNITASTVSRAGTEATVRVGSDLGAYTVTRDGITTDVSPSTDEALLVLRLTSRGWTVERILPAP